MTKVIKNISVEEMEQAEKENQIPAENLKKDKIVEKSAPAKGQCGQCERPSKVWAPFRR